MLSIFLPFVVTFIFANLELNVRALLCTTIIESFSLFILYSSSFITRWRQVKVARLIGEAIVESGILDGWEGIDEETLFIDPDKVGHI